MGESNTSDSEVKQRKPKTVQLYRGARTKGKVESPTKELEAERKRVNVFRCSLRVPFSQNTRLTLAFVIRKNSGAEALYPAAFSEKSCKDLARSGAKIFMLHAAVRRRGTSAVFSRFFSAA